MKKMGGPEQFYAARFVDLKDEITHPIGCYDCHEANTMKLHITRPALLEALKRRDPNFDIDKVSHREMRSLVCTQCHVEYYFRGKGNSGLQHQGEGPVAGQAVRGRSPAETAI